MNLKPEKLLPWIFPSGGNDLSYDRPVLESVCPPSGTCSTAGREGIWAMEGRSFYQGLHFKCIHPTKSVYSVRIGIAYRALGRRHGDEMIWFWIGTHEAYNLIKRL